MADCSYVSITSRLKQNLKITIKKMGFGNPFNAT